MMIKENVNVKAVQDILWHESFKTTMDIYVHSDQEMLREATSTLTRLYA